MEDPVDMAKVWTYTQHLASEFRLEKTYFLPFALSP